MTRALITGITGQDGSYLAELLIEKGYEVIGAAPAGANRSNLAAVEASISFVEGDLRDASFVHSLINDHAPDEVYNLASVATVADPWEGVDDIIALTALAPFHFLEAIRASGKSIRFFQASSAEMFANAQEVLQDEMTPLSPRNPYGVAKVFAHQLVGMYRRDHGMYAVSGILFNHESPRRAPSFITRKVTQGLAALKAGIGSTLMLGNLDASRDWGYAKEYVEAMWRMLQQETPDDYVIATGVTHTVRELVEIAGRSLGMNVTWEGMGAEEVGKDADGNVMVRIDPAFYRPTEPIVHAGNPARLRAIGWVPATSFEELIGMMAKEDYNHVTA